MNANSNSNLLLAVDLMLGEPAWHISPAINMTRDMVRHSADHVVVLHVREFSVGRLASMMREHGGADGRHDVDEIAAGLRASGVQASGLIREADGGHVARTILDAADEFGARAIVLSSARRRIPIGSVAAHIVQVAEIPVVVVPRADMPSGPASPGPRLMVPAQ